MLGTRRLPQAAWTSISSATTTTPSRSRISSRRWPTRTASTSRSSAAGTTRPARRRLTVEDRYDAAARTYELTLSQTTPPTPGQPTKQPLVIPLAMGLLGPDGAEMPTRLAGEDAARRGHARADAERGAARPSASSTCRRRRCRRCCAASRRRCSCAACRSSGCNSSRSTTPIPSTAGRRASRSRPTSCSAHGGRASARRARRRSTARSSAMLRAALDGADDDPAFAAELLTLPSEAFLADQIDGRRCRRDPRRARVRRAPRSAARSPPSSPRFTQRLADPGPYRIDGHAIGRRKLRNVALAYLASAGGDAGHRARQGAIRRRRAT